MIFADHVARLERIAAEFGNGKKHPELEHGETFVGNIDDNSDWYHSIPCVSKRIGITAYAINGTVIPGLRPVFVLTAEIGQQEGVTS